MLEHTLDIALFEKILRLHLGEPLGTFPLADRVAAIRYFPTDSAGEIISAPEGFLRKGNDLWVEYRSLRAPGERMVITCSNKDYLGVLSASAPDARALATAMAQASAGLSWTIQP